MSDMSTASESTPNGQGGDTNNQAMTTAPGETNTTPAQSAGPDPVVIMAALCGNDNANRNTTPDATPWSSIRVTNPTHSGTTGTGGSSGPSGFSPKNEVREAKGSVGKASVAATTGSWGDEGAAPTSAGDAHDSEGKHNI